MRKAIITAVLALAAAAAVATASIRPSEVGGAIKAERPYGTASLTWLFLTAYDASLWTDAPVWSMKEPFALSIAYKMSFTREELVERTLEEMQRVVPGLSQGALARFEARLRKVYPDVRRGERITALYVPGLPVRFFHNGTMTSQVEDADFAEPFFGIWLSPRTSEPSVRAGLLRLSR
jgi:hypothetical protein